ncbi:MAG: VOC family protein [Bacteriovoracia bacterium]
MHPVSPESFLAEGEVFFARLREAMHGMGLPVDEWRADHLCFRVATLREYSDYKNFLGSFGTLLTESEVNGRPISTYRLATGFPVTGADIDASYEIPLVELPAPKKGSPYPTGFEHAEFVIDRAFDAFVAAYPKLSFKPAREQILNPELCLNTPAGQAKFHHLPLDRVIEIEQACITDVIFDFDGTLIHSIGKLHEVNAGVFSQVLGREVTVQEAREKFFPEFPKLFSVYGVSEAAKQLEAIRLWSELAQQMEYDLFDGVESMLARLSARGLRLHLWTARDRESAAKILKHHRLEDIFQTFSHSTPDHSKPHPGSLKFDWQAAAPNSVLLVGDSATDMRGAKAAKAISGAAFWCPHVDRDHVTRSGAELFFNRIDQLGEWLSES